MAYINMSELPKNGKITIRKQPVRHSFEEADICIRVGMKDDREAEYVKKVIRKATRKIRRFTDMDVRASFRILKERR